jgi:phage terminase large subunit-like protein
MGELDPIERHQRYIQAVIGKSREVAKVTRQLVQRAKRDHKRPPGGYRFDPDRGRRVCRFIEQLPHIKGRWESPLIRLEDWQCFVLAELFGWVDVEGFRRFKTAYVEIPRKNAKSTIAAGVALYLLTFDDEPGAEVYTAARTKEQARIVFDIARAMAATRHCRSLLRKNQFEVLRHAIASTAGLSTLRPLSREQDGNLDGLNVHGAIIDELHAHTQRDVVEVMQTATGARRHPLIWEITTAGKDLSSVCYEHNTYTRNLLARKIEDPEWFGAIWTIDDADLDQWDQPRVWSKANPNLAVSVSAGDLERKARQARASPAAKVGFQTRHLNVWHNAGAAAWDIHEWRRLGKKRDITKLYGAEAYLGLDLSITDDFTSRALLVHKEGRWHIFDKHWLPESKVRSAEHLEYYAWAEAGHLTMTAGNVTDFEAVREDLRWCRANFGLIEAGYDPWNAADLAQQLMADDVPMVEVSANTKQYSPAMKVLQRWILEGAVTHQNNPVLNWHMANVICHEDVNSNIFPRRESKNSKIDGAVAIITAIARARFMFDRESVYENRGIYSI